MFFVCHECVEQRKNNLETQNFSLFHAHDRWKTSFFISLPSSKLTISLIPFLLFHFSYPIYKHDAMDIADSSSLQDMCHMNFVIDLAHHSVSVVQW